MTGMEFQIEVTRWELDDQAVSSTLGPVVGLQLAAELACLDAHGRIDLWVVVRRLAEGFDADGIFLEIVAVMIQSPLGKVLKQALKYLRVAEGAALQNLAHLSRPGIERIGHRLVRC